MSKTRFLVALAIVSALALLSAFGAGWKWRHAATGSQERVAGWTWDGAATSADS